MIFDDSISLGHCQCGCGQKTLISQYTSQRRGLKRGEPLHFVRGHQRYHKSLEMKFWDRVSRTVDAEECWLWFAGRTASGYGILAHHGRSLYAHRLAYEIHNGPIPRHLHVLHRCDNPPCVNPAHLFLGDHRANMNDMVRKGRNCHKLTHADADVIRELKANGIATKDVAELFGVSTKMVGYIVRDICHRKALYGVPGG